MNLFSDESIRTYRMITSELEPDNKNFLLKNYFAYIGNSDLFSKVFHVDDFIRDPSDILDTGTGTDINISNCINHGIMESLDFAKWCKQNIPKKEKSIHAKISEKFIMNNMLDYVLDNIYCIWYPEIASEKTYEELYTKYPKFKYIIGRACIIAGYTNLYKKLDLLPDATIYYEIINSDKKDFVHLMENRDNFYAILNDSFRSYEDSSPEIINISDIGDELEVICYKDIYHEYNKKFLFNERILQWVVKNPLREEDFEFVWLDCDMLQTSRINTRLFFIKKKILSLVLNAF